MQLLLVYVIEFFFYILFRARIQKQSQNTRGLVYYISVVLLLLP